MTPGQVELADFLLARIAEDEAVAREATPGPWEWRQFTPAESYARNALEAPNSQWNVLQPEASDPEGAYVEVRDADAGHIARWDPARVLAECDAKRRIVEAIRENDNPGYAADPDYWSGAAVGDSVLRLLALPYADHPDYDPDWRP